MTTLHWFLPLERHTTLDAVRAEWPLLLEQHRLTSAYAAPRYEDAVLAFLGLCALPPRIKLAAVLALGAGFDIDLRLALGALGEAVLADGACWPDSVAAAVSDNGPALTVDTNDAWLGAFIAGRLAGLRDTLTHDGTRPDDWRAAFWNRFLAMACRHGATDAVALALQHGADPRADDDGAVRIAARGAPTHAVTTPAEHVPGDADYRGILLQLGAAGVPHDALLACALPAAAGVNNTNMLAFLIAHGAAPDAAVLTDALAGAAGNLAYDAFAWLLEHGADVDPDDGSILAAAAASLDETMVALALDAGADAATHGARALAAAAQAQPWHLYSDEDDFDARRADMLALLRRHGAVADADVNAA